MKKNKMMRIASVLMVAALLTTCAISGTFAKYVTSDSAKDSARVAKWGVTILASGSLFEETYKKATDNTANTVDDVERATLSVVSNTVVSNTKVALTGNDDVVAPGTKNTEGMTWTFTGTPEVDGKIAFDIKAGDGETAFDPAKHDIYLKAGTYGVMVKDTAVTKANFAEKDRYTKDGTTYTKATAFDSTKEYYDLHDKAVLAQDYYPVVFFLNNTAIWENTAQKESSLKKIVDLFGTLTDDDLKFEDNTNLANLTITKGEGADAKTLVNNGAVKLTWEWDFDVNTDDTNTNAADLAYRDGADTILGNLAAGTLTNAEVVKLSGENYVNTLTAQTDYNLNLGISVSVSAQQLD